VFYFGHKEKNLYIFFYTKKERDTAKNKTEFIKTFLPVYRKVLKEKGISEDFAESLVAQAALESA
jgi:flagellum-specific peptidoglycan hydrolase FlgJ